MDLKGWLGLSVFLLSIISIYNIIYIRQILEINNRIIKLNQKLIEINNKLNKEDKPC